ncbi:MAG TPA: sensor domain-containing protein [Sporichthya sp.]|nr:sensor domain-containing protein [Sporichthya sp.]
MFTPTDLRETLRRAPLALKERRTWGALAHLLVGLVLAFVELMAVFLLAVFGVALLITFIGLPLIALMVLTGRRFGRWHRRLSRRFNGTDVADPAPFEPAPGVLGALRSALRDSTGWRGLVYVMVKAPLAFAGGYGVLLVWGMGVAGATYPIWWSLGNPTRVENDGARQIRHHSGIQFGDLYMDNWGWALLVTLVGALLLIVAAWLTRGLMALDAVLVRGLLGPGSAARVRELELSRASVVQGADATLRRLERDLHDGTQARLVQLAMNVGLARTRLEEARAADGTADAAEVTEALRLLDNAHRTAKDAIVELRTLVHGIHPPVLDTGLEHALATLAARSAVPVTLHADLPARPTPAVEAIAYFCAAELLTNAARHSGAAGASLDVELGEGRLVLRVTDDGRGGARVGAGSGLTGLAERVAAVDGRLDVVSPAGGPTVVSVTLPAGV